MKNTNKEFAEALRLMDQARDLQDKANEATLKCLNYLEHHTDKSLRNYGTDLMYNRNLLEAIENYMFDCIKINTPIVKNIPHLLRYFPLKHIFCQIVEVLIN